MGTEEERCRHLLNIEKDVKATDDILELLCREFETLKHVRHISYDISFQLKF
jgi:hypothetical protein